VVYLCSANSDYGWRCYFYISQSVSNYQSQRRNEQYRLEKNQGIAKAINAPMAFHYYDMRPVSGSSDHVYLKVLNANQQTVIVFE